MCVCFVVCEFMIVCGVWVILEVVNLFDVKFDWIVFMKDGVCVEVG